MIFPLEELTKYKGSIYEITVAASIHARQLAKLKDSSLDDENEGKEVSLAARKLFTNEVQYRIEQTKG